MLNRQIFREYDIRGVADRDFDADTLTRIAHALVGYYRRRKQNRIAIGRDCRLSSPRMYETLSSTLKQGGLHLVDLGVIPTPLGYFAVHHENLDGLVQITGSHNPPEDNGLKIMSGKETIFGADIQELLDLAQKEPPAIEAEGSITVFDPLPAYINYIKSNIQPLDPKLKVAFDAGNGAAGPTAYATMQALGITNFPLLCEMDGRFPVHHPDPTQPENLALLKETVLREKCDVGLAFDGDGDRLGVIDQKGEVLWGDKLLTLFSREILKVTPGASVIGEVKCSQTLYDDIAKHGGRPIIWKTGHSLIKKKMKEEKALLAGEMSGHLFFADRYYGFDDALYAALRLLEILSHTNQSLVELLADLPQTFATPELRVDCSDQQKFKVVEHVANHFRKTHSMLEIDGARIQFEGGWGLVRASNTQPVLVLRFEALSPERLQAIENEVRAVVERSRLLC